MSEESPTTDEGAEPIGGERLRAARRENDISVRDIAKELHLDEPKVRALEKNEFDVLGAPVFAKGHLRKYAELVGVSVDDVMSDYYQMNRSVGAPPVVGLKRQHQRDISPVPWIAAGVVIVVVVATAYWWFTREPTVLTGIDEPAMLVPFAPGTEPELTVAVQPEPGPDITATGAETAAVASPDSRQPANADEPPTTETANEAENPALQVRVDLTFSGDCWTEVSDASGRRLFYELGRAGTVVTLSGEAPLRVILGDSANVSISVAGRDYPIPAAARSGRLARLSINRT